MVRLDLASGKTGVGCRADSDATQKTENAAAMLKFNITTANICLDLRYLTSNLYYLAFRRNLPFISIAISNISYEINASF